jgi:hypothetical protein
VLACALVRPNVCGVDGVAASTAVRDYELGGAGLRVVRMLVVFVDSADRDAVNTVGVAIEVAVVITGCTVASSEDVYGTLATAPLLNCSNHGFLDKNTRGLHSLTIVRWAPRARVDEVLLHLVVDGQRLINVTNVARENAHTRDLRIVRQTNTAGIVLSCRNLSGASSAVSIIGKLWRRELLVVVVVV